MGVVLSLLAHLKSSALPAIKGYTPQGTVGRVVYMQSTRCFKSVSVVQETLHRTFGTKC